MVNLKLIWRDHYTVGVKCSECGGHFSLKVSWMFMQIHKWSEITFICMDCAKLNHYSQEKN